MIHKVDGAPHGWGDGVRRVLAGTAAVDDCQYQANEEHALGRHGLHHGDPLRSPYFPIIYPRSDPAERASLRSGEVPTPFPLLPPPHSESSAGVFR